MERQRSIQQESFERTAESGQEIGLQLRSAAERGRLLDVRKLLSCGAPVLKDSVSLSGYVCCIETSLAIIFLFLLSRMD